MKPITFKQYRNIDLTILAVMLAVFETVTTFATNKWFFAQPIAISVTLTMVCIAMMRWGGYAAISAVVGGFVYCTASGTDLKQYAIYCIGNLLALAALLLIKLWGKEKIRNSAPRLMLFVLTAYVGQGVGRWLMSLLFGGELWTLVVYLTSDIITLLFAEIIVVLLRKVDGMIEDQKSYLLRLEEERKEEENSYVPEEEY